MGGNAFPHLPMVRVNREDVFPTVQYVVDELALPGFTYDYARDNLMGSAGKQATSGDLDFAMNNKPARFYGEPDLPVFRLRDVAERARVVLPAGHVQTRTLRGGQFQTAFPVAGDPAKGYVQVDFVAGDPRWLKFSHFSPGLDVSPYKGVMVSTMLGVLAKMRKDFELYDDGTYAVGEETRAAYLNGMETRRVARVGLQFDLERGLYRSYQLQLRPGQGLSTVTADQFETAVQQSPRFARLGFLTEPSAVLQMLFRRDVEETQVDTFEKLVRMVHRCFPGRMEEAKERFLEAFMRSAGKNDYSCEQLREAEFWSA